VEGVAPKGAGTLEEAGCVCAEAPTGTVPKTLHKRITRYSSSCNLTKRGYHWLCLSKCCKTCTIGLLRKSCLLRESCLGREGRLLEAAAEAGGKTVGGGSPEARGHAHGGGAEGRGKMSVRKHLRMHCSRKALWRAIERPMSINLRITIVKIKVNLFN